MMAIDQLRWPVKARPNVHVAGLFPLDARGFDHIYQTPLHVIHLHEYVGTIRLAGRDYRLEPGTLTLSLANEESSYDLPRPGVHWCIHFDPQKVDRKVACLGLPLVCHLGAAQGEAVKRFSHIARIRDLMINAERDDAAALREVIAVALQELLLWFSLFDRMESHRASQPRNLVIDQLFDFIDRNLGRKFRAHELAAHAGLSRNHLARLFRQRTGVTLPRHVLTRRINLARLLLETTNLPIKQIAMRVGMPDPHHFNKQFRYIAGISPSQFRLGNACNSSKARVN